MSLIIAGERSGVGKTTVTLAILSFLTRQKSKVQSFKVGPDYIDPMFHAAVTGRPCRNLDPILTSETYVRACFASHCQDADYTLVEGVMGLFDGVSSPIIDSLQRTNDKEQITDFASTAHIARLLKLPVLLVVDCSRLSGSVAAIVHGYRSFDPNINLAGVILNRVGSDRHLTLLKDALEPLNIPILGILHRHDEITIPDRHLGLIPTAELNHLETLFEKLARIAKINFDWERLFPLLQTSPACPSPPLPLSPSPPAPPAPVSLKIAIARDRAFNFYYQDNLDILERLGAELLFWSPIENERFPAEANGLYFGGGFPEIFARELAENHAARAAVRQAILAGMPTYAECGGLMYLCEELIDFDGQSQSMVGVLPTTAVMGKQLTLGYRQATALTDWLSNRGDTIRGHEFHRSRLTSPPQQPLFAMRGYSSSASQVTLEGWQIAAIHASYLHIHFGDCLSIPQKFLRCCVAYPGTNKLS